MRVRGYVYLAKDKRVLLVSVDPAQGRVWAAFSRRFAAGVVVGCLRYA